MKGYEYFRKALYIPDKPVCYFTCIHLCQWNNLKETQQNQIHLIRKSILGVINELYKGLIVFKLI